MLLNPLPVVDEVRVLVDHEEGVEFELGIEPGVEAKVIAALLVKHLQQVRRALL